MSELAAKSLERIKVKASQNSLQKKQNTFISLAI
jgi:hypothetical protein